VKRAGEGEGGGQNHLIYFISTAIFFVTFLSCARRQFVLVQTNKTKKKKQKFSRGGKVWKKKKKNKKKRKKKRNATND
jgi:hypothetical protein